MSGLFADLRRLADRVAHGQITDQEIAEQLRALATFTPDETSRRIVSMSTTLATIYDNWPYRLQVDHPSFSGEHPSVRLVSNRFTEHVSNLDTVLDLTWVDPDRVEHLGRALIHAAALLRAAREHDRDDA